MNRTDKILIGVAGGALLLRALRGADVRTELARLHKAFEGAHSTFETMARRAVGCTGKQNKCTCAICAERSVSK
jgi:hypothetical protein